MSLDDDLGKMDEEIDRLWKLRMGNGRDDVTIASTQAICYGLEAVARELARVRSQLAKNNAQGT